MANIHAILIIVWFEEYYMFYKCYQTVIEKLLIKRHFNDMAFNVFAHPFSSSSIQQSAKPVLEKLRLDSDMDVQYFTQEALEGKDDPFT